MNTMDTQTTHRLLRIIVILLVGISVFLPFAARAQQLPSEWQQSQKTDTLKGVSYQQFRLEGKWLTPPKHGAETPALVVSCKPGPHNFGHVNGKFIDGYFATGAMLNTDAGNRGSIITVQFRLDDKKIQEGFWSPSTDFSGAFFTDADLNILLYGHMLPHKEGKGDPVHKVVIAVDEYLAAQMVAQFDMPDPSRVAEACGAVWHK